MKINSINYFSKFNSIQKNKFKNITKPNDELEKKKTLEDIPISYINFKGVEEAEKISPLKYTDDAKILIETARLIAINSGHDEITPNHIILASIIETEQNYKLIPSDAFEKGAVETISLLNRLADSTSNKHLASNALEFNYFMEETQILKDNIINQLAQENKEQVDLDKQLNISADLENELRAVNIPSIDSYMLLGTSFNTLTKHGIEYTNEFLKNLMALNLYMNSDDISKNYMEAYDSRALDIWNKLAIGSSLFLISENAVERDRLLSSMLNTFDSPKPGNFNSNNTNFYAISESATPELLLEEINTLKEGMPDKKLLFFIDLDKIWQSVLNINGDSAEYKTELLALPSLAKDNVKFVFLQSDDLYYQFMQTPLVKKAFSKFLTYNIPPIRSYEVNDILAKNKKLLKQVHTPFTKDAKDAAIMRAENIEGVYPDKAIDLMNRISEYYGDTRKRITSKDVEHFSYVAHDLFKENSDSSIVYNTGKTLATYYGKETTKKDIEAIVRQIQTGKIGTRGMIIYSQDDEAGSGRKYTAQVIAGEAKVPFMEISASDFATPIEDESGAKIPPTSYISKLFTELKIAAEQNPNKTAVMYISNFEEFAFANPYMVGCKQAMSQLLREMALAEKEDINILVMGSTFEDYLEYIPIFARGFSQSIAVDSPAHNKRSRKEVLEHRILEKKLPLAYKTKAEKEILLDKLVKLTEYLSYVQIKTLIEKAEQIMIERNKKRATIGDFIEAYLQIEVGRTSRPEMQNFNKEVTTSHECGHATNLEVMNNIYNSKGKPWFDSMNVNFITLDPRGDFLGAVFEGRSDNTAYPFEAMFADLVCSYGGHSCEKEFYDMDGSVGITQDLAQAAGLTKRGIELFGFGYNTGKISNAARINSVIYNENVYKDMEIILKNAQLVSDMITEHYKGFNVWFTNKYSKLIGTDDCMVDGDDFRKSLKAWVASQPEKIKRDLSLMEDIVLDVIKSTKNGKLYPQFKKLVK